MKNNIKDHKRKPTARRVIRGGLISIAVVMAAVGIAAVAGIIVVILRVFGGAA